MKRILCYVVLVLLIVLIVLPPVLRVFAKEEAYVPPKDVVSMLSCTRDNESISMPYLNGNLVSIKYTFPVTIINPDSIVDADNLGDILEDNDVPLVNNNQTIKNVLENITNTKSETVDNLTTYLLDMKDTNNSLQVPSEFKGSSEVMKNYYNNLGYTCSIME